MQLNVIQYKELQLQLSFSCNFYSRGGVLALGDAGASDRSRIERNPGCQAGKDTPGAPAGGLERFSGQAPKGPVMVMGEDMAQNHVSREKRALWLNLLCLGLLAAVLAGILTMPRFNYGQILAGQTELLNRQKALEARFATIAPFVGGSDDRTFAALSTVDELPAFLASL